MKKLKSIIILTIIAVSTISTIFIVNSGKPAPEPEPPALMIPLDSDPLTEIDPDLTQGQLYPIQAVYDSDLTDDGVLDMVLGKPMAVQVSVGPTEPELGTTVSVTVTGPGYTETLSTSTYTYVSLNYIYSVYPFVLTTPGQYLVTGSITPPGVPPPGNPLASADIYVSATYAPNIAYSYLDGSMLSGKDYGSISQFEYWTMTNESSRFMNSTYPVASITADGSYIGLAGEEKPGKQAFDYPYGALLNDTIAAANEAQSRFGGAAYGIAIAPDETNTGTDYFTYHGFKDVAGVSFGPDLKGVIVLDDYISAGAHEIGHCLNLYYDTSEQYYTDPPYGKEAYGIDLQEAADLTDAHWRAGICFMGAGPDESMAGSWVSNYVWESLFETLLNPIYDPYGLHISGTIKMRAHNRVSLGLCSIVSDAIVSSLNPPNANFKLVFYGYEEGYLDEVSFYAAPKVILDPKEPKKELGPDFGEKPMNIMPFSFTCAFPYLTDYFHIATAEDEVLHTVYREDLLFIEHWMSNSQVNRITQIETHFTYDQNNEWWNLKNSNAGQLKYHLIVDSLGPETVLEIQLPLAEFHHGDPENPVYEPAFDFLSDQYIRIWRDSTREDEITDDPDLVYIDFDGYRTFTITLDTSSVPKPYLELKFDYAVENDDGWLFKTDPTEYLQELDIIARYKYYDTWLKREMTARAITRFRAVGIW